MNPFESEFMQTHHKNGDKTDNRDSNLECLCIKCHSEVDDTHRRNFNTLAYQGLIKEFLYQYGTERFKGEEWRTFLVPHSFITWPYYSSGQNLKTKRS